MTCTLSDVVRAICTMDTPTSPHQAVGHWAKTPNIIADTCAHCGARDQLDGPARAVTGAEGRDGSINHPTNSRENVSSTILDGFLDIS